MAETMKVQKAAKRMSRHRVPGRRTTKLAVVTQKILKVALAGAVYVVTAGLIVATAAGGVALLPKHVRQRAIKNAEQLSAKVHALGG
jgi:hypothetical protein